MSERCSRWVRCDADPSKQRGGCPCLPWCAYAYRRHECCNDAKVHVRSMKYMTQYLAHTCDQAIYQALQDQQLMLIASAVQKNNPAIRENKIVSRICTKVRSSLDSWSAFPSSLVSPKFLRVLQEGGWCRGDSRNVERLGDCHIQDFPEFPLHFLEDLDPIFRIFEHGSSGFVGPRLFDNFQSCGFPRFWDLPKSDFPTMVRVFSWIYMESFWYIQSQIILVLGVMGTSARSENHEHEGFSGFPKMNLKSY